MPEGDTIATLAAAMRPWLVGARITGVDCRWPRVVEGLTGTTVLAVETVGKHLMLCFDDGTRLRVHLKMTGSWHRYDPDEPWQRSRADLAVALSTAEHQVVCFKAPEVERIDARALPTHPVLSSLGPDLARPPVDLGRVVARARERGHERLGDLLLDQRVACGLGNVYKSELGFLFGLHPWTDPGEIDDDTLRGIYRRGSELLVANTGRARNTTGRPRPDTWVYGRAGRPCLRCGARVRSGARDALDRVSFWCPRCQDGPVRSSPAR